MGHTCHNTKVSSASCAVPIAQAMSYPRSSAQGHAANRQCFVLHNDLTLETEHACASDGLEISYAEHLQARARTNNAALCPQAHLGEAQAAEAHSQEA